MHDFINSPWKIGSLLLKNRLIQGPLAGFSCTPFRELFYQFKAPAYCVTEMCSARDVIYKHDFQSRYLHRSPQESILCYQISGTDNAIMYQAAQLLESLGADLIDINCGCPKTKIRKKGAGSALLENPQRLRDIIQSVRDAITIPLTIKIRIQGNEQDILLARIIEDAGADALIVHGRRWLDDYDIACDLDQIAKIKKNLSIPVIANGDIHDRLSLQHALKFSACDAFMISRAGSGRPWLYQELLDNNSIIFCFSQIVTLFIKHLEGLACLETEFKALLQSKTLVRYYFKPYLHLFSLEEFYQLNSIDDIEYFFLGLLSLKSIPLL